MFENPAPVCLHGLHDAKDDNVWTTVFSSNNMLITPLYNAV